MSGLREKRIVWLPVTLLLCLSVVISKHSSHPSDMGSLITEVTEKSTSMSSPSRVAQPDVGPSSAQQTTLASSRGLSFESADPQGIGDKSRHGATEQAGSSDELQPLAEGNPSTETTSSLVESQAQGFGPSDGRELPFSSYRASASLRRNKPSLDATMSVEFSTDTDVPNITTDCPPVCQCSKGGISVNCEGKKLTEIPDGIPKQVEVLYMDHNIFSVLKTGTLQNFQSLEKVYLRNCHVQTLNPGAFRNLPALRELYLTTNVIDKLQSDAFQNVSALSLLNLAANRLTSVPDLSTLTGLSQLVMEANRIQNGTFPNGFASLHSLSTVVLSNNNLTELTNETFATLANCSIRRLEISRCNIKTVATGALTTLRLLQSLKIGNNPIDGTQLQNMLLGLSEDLNLVSLDIRQINLGGVLPSGSFSILAKTPIVTLIFRNNEIGSITARAFAHLPKLVMLDLGYCKIQNVDPQAFADLPALQRLFLYNNLLMTVPTNLPQSLTYLYLQFNMLGALKSGDFVNLGKLQELYLSNNKINEVSEDSFQGLVNLQILHLQQNLLSYIPKKLFSYTSRLRILFLRFNNIQNLKPNPGALSSLTSLVTLDMSHNECSYIPFDYFADLASLETLYLDFNRLSGLMAGDTGGQLLSKLGSLKRLGLMSNDIYQIHDAQFRNLVSLDTLNLKNNRLSSWGSGLFHTPGSLTRTLQTVDLSSNQIALVNETSVRDLQNVKMLNLSLNPFACTCDLRWFRSWLNNTMVTVANKTTYTCNSPPEWANKLLLTFGADKINCIDYTWYYVGSAIGATLLIALVVCYVIYRHRWFIFLRLYRLRKALGRCCCGGDSAPKRAGYEQIPGVDVEETPRYEFYVIAASEDNDWVEQKLLPKLDSGPVVGNQGERYGGRFRLYYEPRDEKDGRTHVGNFDENMPLCRAALVVLSRYLVRDDWCRFLIDQSYQLKAENRLKEVRIIKKDQDILPRHIPRLMHRAMEKREFTDWIETTEHLEDSLGLGRILTDDDQGQSDSLAQEQEQAHLERGIN